MNDIKSSIGRGTSYNRSIDKEKSHTKTLDSKNRTIHNYSFLKVTKINIQVTDNFIKFLLFCLGTIVGALFHSLLLKYSIQITNFLIYVKNNVERLNPFISELYKGESNFRYIFNFSFVVVIVITIVYIVFFTILLSDNLNCYKRYILFIPIFMLFFLLAIVINFQLCKLLIKIPKYFKIISSILSIIINLIYCIILLLLTSFIYDNISE